MNNTSIKTFENLKTILYVFFIIGQSPIPFRNKFKRKNINNYIKKIPLILFSIIIVMNSVISIIFCLLRYPI